MGHLDYNKIDKYNSLFDSGIEFACRIGLCKRDTVIGATDENIKLFCQKNRIILPICIWSSARYFGINSPLANTDYNLITNLLKINEASYQARIKEEWLDGMNVKEYLKAKNFKVNFDYDNPDDNEGMYTPELKSLLDIDDIIFYGYDPFTRTFRFVNSKEENPYVYYFNQYNSVTSNFVLFTNVFRHFLFMIILNYAPQQFRGNIIFNDQNINLDTDKGIDYSDGFEFIKRYQDLLKNLGNTKRVLLEKQRAVFYLINNEVEKKEDRILSCGEFENKFIDYLQQNKIL